MAAPHKSATLVRIEFIIMCGIGGIISKTGAPLELTEVDDLISKVAHRGPDGNGKLVEGDVALVHTRLAIIDLAATGDQPMHYRGGLSIVFNGEIYNYIELREELEQHGHSFRTKTDTEVLLAAYSQWGNDCVIHFNGMWSFAILDRARKKLFCSRDRFGIKPFYYIEDDARFAFGSEINQLLGLLPKRVANLPILIDFVAMGLDEHTDQTFFQDVKSLLGGHSLVFDLERNKFKIEQYYELSVKSEYAGLDLEQSVSAYRELLLDSVTLRLRSDVTVGTCLSGGIDSSTVAAMASQLFRAESGKKFSAITVASNDPVNDETEFARMVAARAGLDWHVTQLPSEGLAELYRKVIRVQQEPVVHPSLLMQYEVFRKAREIGCKVMLDGQGGDETMIGYERYYPTYLRSLPWQSRPGMFREIVSKSKLSGAQLVAYAVYFNCPSLRRRHLLARSKYIKRDVLDCGHWSMLEKFARSFANIQSLQKLELESMQLPHLLKYEDRNSMAHSIESRLPFLDYRVVEAALSLPNRFKVKEGWSKYLLRRASETFIPAEIAWRRDKVGFEAGRQAFSFSENAAENIRASRILSSICVPGAKVPARDQWKLNAIRIWEEEFDVETPV